MRTGFFRGISAFLSLVLVLGCVYSTPLYTEAKTKEKQETELTSSSTSVTNKSNNKNVVPGQEKKNGNKGNNGNNGNGNSGNGKNNGNNSGRVPGQEKKHNSDSPSTPEEYPVSFDVVAGLETAGVELPEATSFAKGSLISDIEIPYLNNYIFAGWYYDKDKTMPVLTSDTVDGPMTLYADLFARTERPIVETPAFSSARLAAGQAGSYTFKIVGYTEGCIKSFIEIGSKEEVPYTVDEDGTVHPVIEDGFTYTIELEKDCDAAFVIDGELQPASMKLFTIVTDMDEVMNVKLDDSVNFIESAAVGNLVGTIFDGMFSTSFISEGENSDVGLNKNEGSFDYAGELAVGDLVAIYEGIRPDLRTLDSMGSAEDGGIAYVKIIGRDGNRYSFTTAKPEEVLFVPDTLPVPVDADMDGDRNNHSITIDASVMDYSDPKYLDVKLDRFTTPDEGDFIAFYSGELETASEEGMGMITSVSLSEGVYVIEYSDATMDDFEKSMEMYGSRNLEFTFTEEELGNIEEEIEQQAFESGFLDEAAEYLVALAVETDGFTELSEDLDLDLSSYNICFADGTPLDEDSMRLMEDEVNIHVEEKDVKANITPTVSLTHFENKPGVRMQLDAHFKIRIGEKDKNHIEIVLDAVFEQEIMFKLDAHSLTHYKKVWFLNIIDDYHVSLGVENGTFVCVGVTATCQTAGEEDEGYKWKDFKGTAPEKVINIGEQITELLGKAGTFMGLKVVDKDGEKIDQITNGGGLAEKYARFMEDADDSWIDLVNKKISEISGTADPLHIVAYNMTISFVIKANVRLSLGASMEIGQADRTVYYIQVFSASASNSEPIPLEQDHCNFDFYVFGTAGAKVGIQFEMAVGLFSTKLDSVGVVAEAGVCAQFWGYFYAHYTAVSGETDGNVSGAVYLEIGPYLEVKFKAQLLSNNDLTYMPTIGERHWVWYKLGDEFNVNDFEIAPDDEQLNINLVCQNTFTIPHDFFSMNYMDMKTGEEGTANYDSFSGDAYEVKISNNYFTYDPDNNLVRINTGYAATNHEECEITFIWKGGPLEFTAIPISRTFHLVWDNPGNVKSIVFDTNGGSFVPAITGVYRSSITSPKAPVKAGYDFKGWYSNSGLSKAYTIPKNMPNLVSTLTLYAKWEARTDTPYKVRVFKEKVDGTYELAETVEMTGTTDEYGQFDRSYEGFKYSLYLSATNEKRIAGDGSTVMDVYFDRKEYSIRFDSTYPLYFYDTESITVNAKYGEEIVLPVFSWPGYTMVGYEGLPAGAKTMIVPNYEEPSAIYYAQFEGNDDSPYWLYVEDESPEFGGASKTIYSEYRKGRTGDPMDYSCDLTESELYTVDSVVAVNGFGGSVIDGLDQSCVFVSLKHKKFTVSFMDGDELLDEYEYPWGSSINNAGYSYRTKNGYVFEGWFFDKECTISCGEAPYNSLTPAYDCVIYGKWEKELEPIEDRQFTIRFDVQDYLAPIDDIVLPKGEYYFKLPEVTVNAGYDFCDWSFSPDGSATEGIYYNYAYVPSNHESGIVTLYPIVKKTTYGITLDAMGGTLLASVLKYYMGDTVIFPIPLANDWLGNVVFDGWYDNPDFEGEPYTEFYASPDNLGWKTFYAKWKDPNVQEFMVNWVASYPLAGPSEDGYYTGKNGAEEAGKEIVAPNLVFPEDGYDYTFEGWKDEDGNLVTDFGVLNSDRTYYAGMVSATVKQIRVSVDCGDGDPWHVRTDYGSTVSSFINNYPLLGYLGEFVGWYIKNADGTLSEEPIDIYTTTVTKELYLVAVYNDEPEGPEY